MRTFWMSLALDFDFELCQANSISFLSIPFLDHEKVLICNSVFFSLNKLAPSHPNIISIIPWPKIDQHELYINQHSLNIVIQMQAVMHLLEQIHGVNINDIQPIQAITFSDFFLADILTSMAKVFSDLERSVCRMVHRQCSKSEPSDSTSQNRPSKELFVEKGFGPSLPAEFKPLSLRLRPNTGVEKILHSGDNYPLIVQVATIAWFEADSVCGSHSIAIPLVLVFPYIFRFFQCLRQYKDTGEKTTLLNALKYSTAVPVIFLSALKYHVFPDRWTNIFRPLWLLSSFINSLYSFYWDVTRDWDLRYVNVLLSD
ncbi:hypothetical protein HHK36_028305 [Tetracentron sinense]|uniref:EXS domain-containing protein n=1 Tax=Tetracentron sinense TaxID=13715 RepID=A0A834YEQ7_TETSI|nr:hypothetical protein HHK36_028305 [Tetracentron sinense]